MRWLILYVGSLALGSVGACVISRWGSAIGILDKANHRSSHDGVVPIHRLRRFTQIGQRGYFLSF